MSRRGNRLRLYIKYLLDHDTIYPIVSIDTGNGWNIQGFIDQAQKERGSFIYYNDWRYLKDKIESDFNISILQINDFSSYQLDKKSLVFNDNKLQWVDLSTKIQPELQVVWAGLEGIVPVKRYDFTVDMSVFQLPEIAKYKIFEEDTSTVEVSLYDYIRINYNWHNNNVTVFNFNLYTKDKGAEPVETKYSDQIEGVSAAYDTFKVYARKHPLLITEMLL